MFENIGLSWSGIWQAFTSYMVELSLQPFNLISLVLDLIIVGYLLYKFIMYAKNSRIWQLLKGVLFILIAVALSDALQLKILNFVLTFFMPYGVIALIVIFQPELRRMLEQLGTNKLTKYFGIEKDIAIKTKEKVYKVVIAATELAKTKTGGLIVLERDIQINDIIDTGVKINAGIGISKESDAIAVIISEETGKISIAKDGVLIADVKEDSLKNILMKHVVTKRFADEKKKRVEKLKNYKEDKKENKQEN